MENANPSFDSLPHLVGSLINEIEGLKSLVKEAIGMKLSEPDNRLVGIDEACKILRRKEIDSVPHGARWCAATLQSWQDVGVSSFGTYRLAGTARLRWFQILR